jgi:hypothetical protein
MQMVLSSYAVREPEPAGTQVRDAMIEFAFDRNEIAAAMLELQGHSAGVPDGIKRAPECPKIDIAPARRSFQILTEIPGVLPRAVAQVYVFQPRPQTREVFCDSIPRGRAGGGSRRPVP